MEKQKWVIDPTHSEIQFKVRHLMITNVTGHFSEYTGEVLTDDDTFTGAEVNFEANIDSISTGNAQRDEHLKSPDFFDAAGHEKLTFKSTSFSKSGFEYVMAGDLTIRGTTLPVKLDVDFTGIAVDPYGQTKAGFEISGKISRESYGLTWNALTEAGGAVVSDEVRLICNVQFVKQ